MAGIDPRMRDAIKDATAKAGQNDSVASRLCSWLEKLLDGTEEIENRESVFRHLDSIYDAILIDTNSDN